MAGSSRTSSAAGGDEGRGASLSDGSTKPVVAVIKEPGSLEVLVVGASAVAVATETTDDAAAAAVVAIDFQQPITKNNKHFADIWSAFCLLIALVVLIVFLFVSLLTIDFARHQSSSEFPLSIHARRHDDKKTEEDVTAFASLSLLHYHLK